MDEIDQIVRHEIDRCMEQVGKRLDERSLSESVLQVIIERVAQVAFKRGGDAALLSLLSAEDVAERLGVSRRRANALIRNRHERFGTGALIGGRWLVTEAELERLRPEVPGWKKGRSRSQKGDGEK